MVSTREVYRIVGIKRISFDREKRSSLGNHFANLAGGNTVSLESGERFFCRVRSDGRRASGSAPRARRTRWSRATRDRRAAAIYAADKLANTRRLLDEGECIDGERLDHYVKTLRLFSEQMPELPFLPEMSVELTRLIDRDAGRIGELACPTATPMFPRS